MKITMPLTQLITQLQAMAAQYPGIECAINDQEWGINLPEVRLQKVYKDDEFEGLNLICDKDYERALSGIREHENVTTQDFWNGNENLQENYKSLGGYEAFAKTREQVYQYFQKVVKNYQKSKEIVVVTTN